jgi:carbon monoxide dehydrogenase subunit G
MKIENSFVVRAPRDLVWRHIVDPTRMIACVPGCESIEQKGPQSFLATVRVEVGPIKSKFNLDVSIDAEEPPSVILSTTRGEEGTRASTLSSKNRLELRALDERTTEVAYSADVTLVGRLGRFGLGMMKKKADSLGASFGRAFTAMVEAGALTEPR